MARSNPTSKSYDRDQHRVRYPSDAAKDNKNSCRYWPHNGNFRIGPLSKVPYMNQDLNSDDLFRGLNPKIQMVQAMSLSAERRHEEGSRDLILIFDVFLAGEDLVLIVSRYHGLNPMVDFSVQVVLEDKDVMDLPIRDVNNPQEMFPRNPNQVSIIKFQSEFLSSLLLLRKQRLSSSQHNQPQSDNNSYIECVVRAGKSTKNFKILINPFYNTPANDGRTLNLVTVTMIGYATQITEMSTWLQYNLRIGFDHVFFYAMFPISCLTAEEVDTLNSLAEATNFSFTLIQWHPYFVDVSDPTASDGHNVLSTFQDLLYRLKGVVINNNSVDIWISSMDVDEFMVVHPRYPSAPAMAKNLMKTCGSLSFANSFFSLLPKSAVVAHQQLPSNLSDWEHLAMPSNFTLIELASGVIVHESNLEEHSYRPKNLFLTRGVIYEGGHGVAEFLPGFHTCESGSFFLHHGENARDRGISTMKEPQITYLQTLLNLPRNNTNPIFTWDHRSYLE